MLQFNYSCKPEIYVSKYLCHTLKYFDGRAFYISVLFGKGTLVSVELGAFNVRPRRTNLQILTGRVGLSGDNPTQPMRFCKSVLLGWTLSHPSSIYTYKNLGWCIFRTSECIYILKTRHSTLQKCRISYGMYINIKVMVYSTFMFTYPEKSYGKNFYTNL